MPCGSEICAVMVTGCQDFGVAGACVTLRMAGAELAAMVEFCAPGVPRVSGAFFNSATTQKSKML